MDKYQFRSVVSQFIFDMRNAGRLGGISQSEFARGLGVRDATVSSWVSRDSCVSAFMLFQIFLFFSRVNRMSLRDVVGRFIEKFETSSKIVS